jgi:hypothetical protein
VRTSCTAGGAIVMTANARTIVIMRKVRPGSITRDGPHVREPRRAEKKRTAWEIVWAAGPAVGQV